ncbi:hypothetical protein HDV57DRAFT_470316 [Trichoderma longibrachiatum]|uniref:Uncharacterized protein n=1 Tax=Trichoderma longibrachiatum ATCC 18648 TaxID=983965 RepID=A0A2T4C5V2_TRILO|nr:hypothetical protein M440DRAFT_1239324 [Trichoderma longibrachiatum ATCC 18648]
MRSAVGKMWHRLRDDVGSRHSSLAISATKKEKPRRVFGGAGHAPVDTDHRSNPPQNTMTRGSACVCGTYMRIVGKSQETWTGIGKQVANCAMGNDNKFWGFSRDDGICGKPQHSGSVSADQSDPWHDTDGKADADAFLPVNNGTRPALIMP